jgi:PEP-CTERM motif
MKRLLLTCFGAILLLCPAAWGTTLQLAPLSGALSGAPGSTVGWGFTITNTSNFLEVTGSDFCEGTIVSPCPHSIGTYNDFIGQFNFVVVGPAPEESTSVTQTFNLAVKTGVGSFRINPAAVAGNSAVGQIVVTYDLFNLSPNDPAFNPALNTVSTGNRLTAPGSVTVAAATPEPATLGLVGFAFVAWAAARRRLRTASARPSCG